MNFENSNFFGYSVRLSQLSEGDGGGWIAYVPELEGCLTDGETPDEAYNNLKEVLALWLEVARETEKNIPAPRIHDEPRHSGRIVLRMPKNLHTILAAQAEQEGVSLNQYMVSLLSYNAGRFEQSATKELPSIINIWQQFGDSLKPTPMNRQSKLTEAIIGRLHDHEEPTRSKRSSFTKVRI
ncbi:MAG: type II toxin-antitoxin system HicB family antitoxin [Firmicutes bacterium]|nr:type II toxin-antitoxin system HicB family antitoxin [Bacillota bacterium]